MALTDVDFIANADFTQLGAECEAFVSENGGLTDSGFISLLDRFTDTGPDDPPLPKLQLLQALRVLLRTRGFCNLFAANDAAMSVLAKLFAGGAERYYTNRGCDDLDNLFLIEAASVVKKLCVVCPTKLCEAGVHHTLILLLGTNDPLVLHSVLVAMLNLVATAENTWFAEEVAGLDCVETLVRIVQEYEVQFKALAAELLGVLSTFDSAREDVRLFQGHSALLSVLHNTDDLGLMQSLLFAIAKIAIDPESLEELRTLGGVPLVLSILDPAQWQWGPGDETLLVSVCTALSQFALDDATNDQIRSANGVFLVGRLLLNPVWGSSRYTTEVSQGESEKKNADGFEAKSGSVEVKECIDDDSTDVWCHAFRTMRLVFSAERNRRVFKGLFPPKIYGSFIDIGHYNTSLAPYSTLCHLRAAMLPSEVRRMQNALDDIQMSKSRDALRKVHGYVVADFLGAGAFGKVFRVFRGEKQFAMKELPAREICPNAESPEKEERALASLRREAEIIRLLDHPCIIKCDDYFVHDGNFCIVMELVEGRTLLEYLTAIAEKRRRLSEDKLWRVAVQIVQALRYLHVEHGVVHRDLTPSNIFLDESNQGGDDIRVKIGDFGLAKIVNPDLSFGGENSSGVGDQCVGTVLYTCPEIVQGQAWSDKADVWSLGCIIYQMATLRPPFSGSNPLSVARAIVERGYDPIDLPGSTPFYTTAVSKVVSQTLQVDPLRRPPIAEVLLMLAPAILDELDRSTVRMIELNDRANREATERQRLAAEALRSRLQVRRAISSRQAPSMSASMSASRTRSFSATNRATSAASRRAKSAAHRRALGTAADPPTLTVSPLYVRQIADQCSVLLKQLHKVVFVAHLPPTFVRDARVSDVRLLHSMLFSLGRYAAMIDMKSELKLLSEGSHNEIPMSFPGFIPISKDGASQVDDDDKGTSQLKPKSHKLTYYDMRLMIETVLRENGYYQRNNSVSTLDGDFG